MRPCGPVGLLIVKNPLQKADTNLTSNLSKPKVSYIYMDFSQSPLSFCNCDKRPGLVILQLLDPNDVWRGVGRNVRDDAAKAGAVLACTVPGSGRDRMAQQTESLFLHAFPRRV